MDKEDKKPPIFGECFCCSYYTELIEFEHANYSRTLLPGEKYPVETFRLCNICYSSGFGNILLYGKQHDQTDSHLSRSIAYSLNMIWSDLCSKLFQMQKDYEEDEAIREQILDMRGRYILNIHDQEVFDRVLQKLKFVPAVDLKEELRDEEQKKKEE